jgi:ComF family protein
LATVLFPSDCRICGEPLTNFSRLPVCEDCLNALAPMHTPACSICGGRVFSTAATQGGLTLCGECRHEKPAFTRAAAYGSYEGGLRELIQLLKYQHVRPAAGVLGGKLHSVLLDLAGGFGESPPLAIPVPLYKSKMRQRGFNQSELIARAALREFRTARLERLELHPELLVRIRPTQSQTGLTRAQRLENVRGAFAVTRKAAVAARDILLVDDVLTTGTTVSECARVLLRAGAARVFVATVARVFAPEPQRIDLAERSLVAHA